MRQDAFDVKTHWGVFLPTDDKLRYTIRFEPDFHERIRIAAAKRHIRSIQQTIVKALEQWLLTEPESSVNKPSEESANVSARLESMEALLQRVEGNERRILELAQARVVEVANQEEKELLTRVVHMLHVTGFQKRLKDLLREVEKERGKHVVDRQAV